MTDYITKEWNFCVYENDDFWSKKAGKLLL